MFLKIAKSKKVKLFMKRNIVSGLLVLIVVIVFSVFIWRSIPTLQRRPPETRLGNTVFLPDTLPKEYATLFNRQQLNHITVSSITYNEGDFPVCIISLMDQYNIIIFKKKIDTVHFQLSNFLKVEHQLRTGFVNNRSYDATDGYIDFMWATETTTKPLKGILMTISEEGQLKQETFGEKEIGYIIDDWQKLNFFYEEGKNADLIFEMNASPFEKTTTAVGLLLKQVENGVCLLFVLPKDGSSPVISKELFETLL